MTDNDNLMSLNDNNLTSRWAVHYCQVIRSSPLHEFSLNYSKDIVHLALQIGCLLEQVTKHIEQLCQVNLMLDHRGAANTNEMLLLTFFICFIFKK